MAEAMADARLARGYGEMKQESDRRFIPDGGSPEAFTWVCGELEGKGGAVATINLLQSNQF
ncbi:MAG: hypothetical protein AB1589_36335, partial [Cyanobacteriota bacterium]